VLTPHRPLLVLQGHPQNSKPTRWAGVLPDTLLARFGWSRRRTVNYRGVLCFDW